MPVVKGAAREMTPHPPNIQVVGDGRVGRAMVAALRSRGIETPEPGLRGATGAGAEVVILAVPDTAIAAAAALIEPGRIVAHVSGATTLAPLTPHECFSLHPLTTITAAETSQTVLPDRSASHPFQGVFAAVAASSPRALELAEQLARTLDMRTFEVNDRDRATYHAAASIASNFLVTLEWFAERLAQTAHVQREAFVPLVQASVRNWASLGPQAALTGPIARGDAETVEWQRAAVAERLPDQLELFDALSAATSQLADTRTSPDSGADADEAAR